MSNSEFKSDAEIANMSPKEFEAYWRRDRDDDESDTETHEEFTAWFDALADRDERQNKSILFAALNAALDAARKRYQERRNDLNLDIDNRDYVATPEHLALVRELDAAEKQIKAWRDAI